MAPSQPLAAVAGVQAASRQHRVPSPFFHCRLPWPLRQLSEAALEPAAKAEPARTTVANNAAILFSFFMFILKIDTTARLAAPSESVKSNSSDDCATVERPVYHLRAYRVALLKSVAIELQFGLVTPSQEALRLSALFEVKRAKIVGFERHSNAQASNKNRSIQAVGPRTT